MQVWQYGKTQDTAQSQSSTGASALANSTSTTLSLSGSSFSYTFPAYSMTVLDLTQAPTVATAGGGRAESGHRHSHGPQRAGRLQRRREQPHLHLGDHRHAAGRVTFSANGTNAAKSTTATFTKAGTYNLQVTITDPAGYSASSTVAITVNPTFSSITVTQAASQLATTGTEQFVATASDQFGRRSQPADRHLVGGRRRQLTTAGVYTPPYTSGAATVKAASGSVNGTLGVTLPGAAQWTSTVAASWNAGGVWTGTVSGTALASPGLRGVSGDTVVFASASASTASLNGVSPSLAAITFSGSGSATIAQGSGGTIQLNGGTSSATLTDSGASSTISAPLALASNVVVTTALHSTLTISGAISGTGYSLTASGPGTLALAGRNSYTGGTIVAGGTLLVESSTALPAAGNLLVRDGASVVLAMGSGSGGSFGLRSMAAMAPPPPVAEAGDT